MQQDAWDVARRAARDAGVEVRPLYELADTEAVNDVIRATWGERSTLPSELLRAFQAGGDPPLGAVAEGRVVGFALGFLGPDAEGVHLHSHMLAVLPDVRRSGVGFALKLAQRAWALDAGIGVARWTFDPLQARNARFNLVKLGAVADRFHRHFYGDMGDELNRGDRSDRMEARWDLDRDPGTTTYVADVPWPVVSREPAEPGSRPSTVRPPRGPVAVVEIPEDYPSMRERHPDLALEWREAVADALEACMAAGMVATGFLPRCAYVFSTASE